MWSRLCWEISSNNDSMRQKFKVKDKLAHKPIWDKHSIVLNYHLFGGVPFSIDFIDIISKSSKLETN